MEDGCSLKSILYLPSSILASTSSVEKVNKLPTSADTPDPDAIAIVIQRRIGELRRRHPEIIFLRKFLGENSLELGPKIVFLPIFENPVARSFRVEAVTEIRRHHTGKRVYVVGGDRFLEATDERLEINIVVFLAEVRFGPLV